MQINLSEELRKHTDLGQFLIEMLVVHEKTTEGKMTDLVTPATPDRPAMAEVEFKIGGVEIDVRKWVDRIEEGLEYRIQKAAADMIADKIGNEIPNKLNEISRLVDAFHDTICEKLGLPERYRD